MNHRLADVELSSIELGRRFREDYEGLDELVASIKEKGVLQPIALMEQEDGKYLLLAGGRRFFASAQLGLETISAKIFPLMDELNRREVELVENVNRKAMSYAELAAITAQIEQLEIAKFGKASSGPSNKEAASLAKIAALLGTNRTTVSENLMLARAIEADPSIGTRKNRSEALKAVQKASADMAHAELARRHLAAAAKTDVDVDRIRLLKSYVLGDFFQEAAKLPDGFFHLCEVDPPYGIDLPNIKQKSSETTVQGYNEIPAGEYVDFISRLLAECYRLLMENGWLIFWFGPDPWFDTVLRAIRKAGFSCNSIPAIWHKVSSNYQANHPEMYMANAYEPFFYARKGSPVLAKQGHSNVFPFPSVPQQTKFHPTERPIEMIEEVIGRFALPTCKLLVPFLGSGNTLLAAANLKIPAVGYDLEQSYKDRFTVRASNGRPGEYRSYV